ncbi:MAG: hypothetical protein ABJA71_05180 [Ginsengibacter sp.]
MEELIKKLQDNHGLTAEQSYGILNTIKEFIKEKFPMVGGAVDNLFQYDNEANTTSSGDTGSTDGPAVKGGSFSDEISH